jgi:CRISPR-associated protein Cas6
MIAQPAIDPRTAGGRDAHAAAAPAVDVAFEVSADTLPRAYRNALRDALFARIPWLAMDAFAGIHPLVATVRAGDNVVLSRRTRLVIRMSRAHAHEALALERRTLDIAGARLTIGVGRVKPLAPFPTIGSAFVATMTENPLAHERAVEAMLGAIGIPLRFICGRMSRLGAGDDELAGGSVVVHALAETDSLRLQSAGLGPHRALGCGLFVPHKAIGALD